MNELTEDKEVDDLQHYMEATSRLSARVAEQDREIERLRDEAAEHLRLYADRTVEHGDSKIRAEKAEARIKELEEGLARAGTILEALNVSVKWELADEIKKEIQSVLPEIHRLLAEKEKV